MKPGSQNWTLNMIISGTFHSKLSYSIIPAESRHSIIPPKVRPLFHYSNFKISVIFIPLILFIPRLSVYNNERHFRSLLPKSLMRVVGKQLQWLKSFVYSQISNTIFGLCRYSNFLQTLTVKHYNIILRLGAISEMEVDWSTLKLNIVLSHCFHRFLPTTKFTRNHCVTMPVTSLISSLWCPREWDSDNETN